MMKWNSLDKKMPVDDRTIALLFVEIDGNHKYYSHGYGYYNKFEDDITITYNPYKNTTIEYTLIGWMELPEPIINK